MVISDFTVGADPELFIINEKTGKVVSSIGLIPGKKHDPYVADDMPEGYGLETDNILAEFNIPPCDNKYDFIYSINYMKDYIDRFVKNVNSDYGIKCSAYEIVDDDQLNTPEAREFGCSPDYNVYTTLPNPKPEGERTNGRSAGCHIHLGYPKHNVMTSLKLIKYLDAFVGLSSVLFDSDKDRRTLYGKAGAFRLTPYGLEYRSLSSAMMKNDDLLDVIWSQLIGAINGFNEGKPIPMPNLVQDAINQSDCDLADSLLKTFNLKRY